jgi:predicted kinase
MDLMRLAVAHLEAGQVRLILVGGLPGTGKSTLASGLALDLGAPVLRSDAIRKELAGIPATTAAPAPLGCGIYSPESTARTYDAMLARARTSLAMGETVVLDASWSDERWRSSARQVARDAHASVVELRCETSASVAAQRISERQHRGGDPSDATPEVAAAMAATMDDWPEAVAIDTSAAPAAARRAARHLLARST